LSELADQLFNRQVAKCAKEGGRGFFLTRYDDDSQRRRNQRRGKLEACRKTWRLAGVAVRRSPPMPAN
jgi:hypothetical protein